MKFGKPLLLFHLYSSSSFVLSYHHFIVDLLNLVSSIFIYFLFSVVFYYLFSTFFFCKFSKLFHFFAFNKPFIHQIGFLLRIVFPSAKILFYILFCFLFVVLLLHFSIILFWVLLFSYRFCFCLCWFFGSATYFPGSPFSWVSLVFLGHLLRSFLRLVASNVRRFTNHWLMEEPFAAKSFITTTTTTKSDNE